MTLRIGIVNYINALPFTLPFKLHYLSHEDAFFYEHPTRLNKLLADGELDVTLTSSVEVLEKGYAHVPHLGIAAAQEILSVNLYHKTALKKITQIAVTSQSATSVALLKILCDHAWHISPSFVPLDPQIPFEHYDAFLLIGDDALKHFEVKGYERTDLAASWFDLTHLPFVFALFSYRAGISSQKIEKCRSALAQAISWSTVNRALVEKAAQQQLPLPAALLDRYYTSCRYVLGNEEMAGFEEFKRLKRR